MNKKKVGLATCFLDNSGACLQAFALQQAIIDLNNECEIIKYYEPNTYRKPFWAKRTIKDFLHCATSYRFPYAKFLYHYNHRNFNKFRKRYLIFSKKSFRSINEIRSENFKYDLYVCGSDQIWNPTLYNKCEPVYMLDFDKEKKKVSYAPSIGLSEYPKEYENDFCTLLKNFAEISVREKQGEIIINKISKDKATTVLDPTLLFDKDLWLSKLPRKKIEKAIIKEKYILC
jgi:hypothetical protein